MRLSDAETERRMLAAALATVSNAGLTVSLDHISFEDVIRDAGVSRSSAYRRWPHKDLFFSDLIRELARSPTPSIVEDEVKLISEVVAGRLEWLETPELRQSLAMELFRQLPVLDFETLYTSPEWRTYLGLHATFMSLSDGQLRDQVQHALADSERARIVQVARAWEHMAALFGYRLRPELGATFENLATVLSATLRGLVIMALSLPDVASHRAKAQPFGSAAASDWSLPALGMAGLASAFLEPDPAASWDADRINAVRRSLSQPALGRASRNHGGAPASKTGAGSDIAAIQADSAR
jgi:AcrR family transcriptional regulator